MVPACCSQNMWHAQYSGYLLQPTVTPTKTKVRNQNSCFGIVWKEFCYCFHVLFIPQYPWQIPWDWYKIFTYMNMKTIKTNVFIPIFPSSIPWQLPWEEHVYLPIHDMADFYGFRVGSLPETNKASENHGWKIKSLFGARPFYPIFKGFGC